VQNALCIGTPEIGGILLYGTNMVGKSAYMKSLGISIIMAQSGMFVPCEDFMYYPYQHIFTRIPSGDDLFKGQSTFAVEISELRNILNRCTRNSLVIGDELASGTESISAVSIVAAGIIQLNSKNASFVFATHLHDLPKLEKIKSIQTLKIYHLSVSYDEVGKKLVFDRILKPGQGSTLYGLEVCRALDLNREFLRLANECRQELCNIEPDILSTKQSRYNSAQFLDVCSICKSPAQEVHHIQQQKNADQVGFIGSMHKNARSNLMNVCQQCHDDIHNGSIDVNGYVQTTDGVELKLSRVKLEHIDSFVQSRVLEMKFKGFSIKKIRDAIKDNDGIDITPYRINKILRECQK
jgi:DNA mismatch repair protein MutS